jgi:outer membrane immunogenic protein
MGTRPMEGLHPFSWTGFYIGVNAGYGWSDSSDKFALTATGFHGLEPEGGFGGGQIGYNWQSANLVLGVEADIQGSGIEDKATDAIGNIFKSRLDYFGTVRGRLGYAFGPSLLYATGGFAYGGIRNDAISVGPVPFKFSGTASGYVVGGGYEYKLNPAWSLKTEYQYINLGRNDPENAAFGSACKFGPKCEDDAYHTIRLGLNYRFDSDRRYAPLK